MVTGMRDCSKSSHPIYKHNLKITYSSLCTEENSENYLFTGKERDPTGLYYYYSAQYYDPEVGRFMARDQKKGKVGVPGTLNGYAYCANNPTKFLDPDGRDYFDPAWGQGCDGTWGSELKFALVRVGLWILKGQGELLTSYWNWASQNPHLSSLFGAGLAGVAAFCLKAYGVGGYYGVVAGLIVGVASVGLNWMAENASHLWNDPEYIELYETIEMYAEQLMKGYDCEQEYLDAWCMLAVYPLMKQCGDNWREYADPELLDYHDEKMQRKKDDPRYHHCQT
jgi:RHS repeat-associated protein